MLQQVLYQFEALGSGNSILIPNNRSGVPTDGFRLAFLAIPSGVLYRVVRVISPLTPVETTFGPLLSTFPVLLFPGESIELSNGTGGSINFRVAFLRFPDRPALAALLAGLFNLRRS